MNQPQNSNRLNSGLGTLKSLISAIPLGTSTILLISLFILVINVFTSWKATEYLCLASTNTTNSLFTHLPSLFGNQLAHSSIWHEIVATVIFPFVASGIEQQVGTFQFLAFFFIGGFITSFIYVISMFFLSFIFPSWGLSCVSGLDIPFFMFLTVEGLNGRGLFEITSRFGLNIPREFYFMPFFALLAILTPLQAWFPKLFATAVGYLYYLQALDAVLLTENTINTLETAGILQWYCNYTNFIIKPGAVQLPMPGAFRDDGTPDERGSFLTQVSNALRPSNDKYAPIQNYQGVERTASPNLLWDEEDEGEPSSNDNKPLLQGLAPKKDII